MRGKGQNLGAELVHRIEMNEIRVEVAAKEERKNGKIATVPRNHGVPIPGDRLITVYCY